MNKETLAKEIHSIAVGKDKADYYWRHQESGSLFNSDWEDIADWHIKALATERKKVAEEIRAHCIGTGAIIYCDQIIKDTGERKGEDV